MNLWGFRWRVQDDAHIVSFPGIMMNRVVKTWWHWHVCQSNGTKDDSKPWSDTAMLLCKEVWSVMRCLYGAASCVLSVSLVQDYTWECIPWELREIDCIEEVLFDAVCVWLKVSTYQAKRGHPRTLQSHQHSTRQWFLAARCPGGGWVDSRLVPNLLRKLQVFYIPSIPSAPLNPFEFLFA